MQVNRTHSRIPRTWLGAPLAALLLSILTASDPAWAQTIPSPYQFIQRRQDVGIIAGSLQERRGDVGIGPGGGTFFGGRYALELGSGPFAVVGTGYLASTDRVVLDAVPNVGLTEIGVTDVTLWALDARLRFTITGPRTWHGVAPYLMLGGGLAGDLAGPSELEAELEAGEQFGFGPTFLGVGSAGTRWIPGDRLTFHAEVSYQIWKLGTPVGFFDVEEEAGDFSTDQWIGVGALVLGVSYRY